MQKSNSDLDGTDLGMINEYLYHLLSILEVF